MHLLEQAAVFLLTAVLLVPLFQRLKLGAVLGYLGAGMLIGPFGLGMIGEVESTLQFAEFGVVLLLFLVGLELQPSRTRSEEHTSELQSHLNLVCRLLLEKKKSKTKQLEHWP